MTRIFEDDFESGDLLKWTEVKETDGCTCTIDTTNPKSGTYNLKSVYKDGAGGGHGCVQKAGLAGTKHDHLFAQASNVKIDKMPAGEVREIRVLALTQGSVSDGVVYAGFYVDNGTLKFSLHYRTGSAFSDIHSTVAAQINTNYLMELEVLQSSEGQADGLARLYVDGEVVCEATELDNDDRAINYAQLGVTGSNSTGAGDITITADDYVLATEYIGLPPPPPSLAEQISSMMSVMINVMMVVMVIRMMSGMLKGLKK